MCYLISFYCLSGHAHVLHTRGYLRSFAMCQQSCIDSVRRHASVSLQTLHQSTQSRGSVRYRCARQIIPAACVVNTGLSRRTLSVCQLNTPRPAFVLDRTYLQSILIALLSKLCMYSKLLGVVECHRQRRHIRLIQRTFFSRKRVRMLTTIAFFCLAIICQF